jgi:FAD/FMN-containing dehydrogenase
MKPVSRRTLLRTAAAVLRTVPARAQSPAPTLLLDDASRLNAVPIARHWRPGRVIGEAWLAALRAELKTASAEGRPVSVGAARHSMGGQALARDGVAMTLDVKPAAEAWIEIDRDAKTFRVAAGARWRQVIGTLDPAFAGFVLARVWAPRASARR